MLMLMVSSNAPYNALYNTLQGTLAILQFRNFWKQDQTTTPELHSLLFTRSAHVLKCHLLTSTDYVQETGPTVLLFLPERTRMS